MFTDVIDYACKRHCGRALVESPEQPERISEAEHAVMEALWQRAPQTASEVCEQVCQERDWSLATVKTLLSRLVIKQAVATEPDGKRFLYTPRIARDAYVGTESRRLVDRLFGGRAAPLFAHLAETQALTEDDIAEIETLLRELKS
jgi:predicted transcriptional regulator